MISYRINITSTSDLKKPTYNRAEKDYPQPARTLQQHIAGCINTQRTVLRAGNRRQIIPAMHIHLSEQHHQKTNQALRIRLFSKTHPHRRNHREIKFSVSPTHPPNLENLQIFQRYICHQNRI